MSREVRFSLVPRTWNGAPLTRVSRPQTAALLAEEALVWSAQNGLVVAAAQAGTFTHAPLSLLPTPLPRDAFERARALAAPFGRLTAAVAADAEFLRTTLAGACASDEFTARLFALFDLTRGQKARTPPTARCSSADVARLRQAPSHGVEVGLLRSDYMVDAPTGALLQVEVNTIAASFACLSALTGARARRRLLPRRELTPALSGRMHRHLVKRVGLERAYAPAALPENNALEGMAGGLAAAWREV